ncbi:MAG TPA: hypothetical protein PLH94_03045 [Fimbriimonadaceae bacterium]|nr:hypothetical protein [Fimbriimonadaceae bacterium]
MKWTFALFVAGVVLVIGCGGGGGGSAGNRTPTDQTRNRLDTSLDVSWKAMIQSGIHTPAFADRRNEGGGTTGGGTGGVGGGMAMPMVGAFFRNFHGGGFLSPGGRDTEPGTSGGSGGDEPPPWNSFYYDEYLGLWVQVDFTEGSFSFLLYEDEAKTQPAGHMTSTWPTDWTTYPQTIESSYEFRAGFLAGSSGSYVVTMTNDSTGTMTYTNIGNDGSSSSGTSTWAAGGSNWQNEATLRDGKWFKDRGAFQADGSGQTQSENSLGYKWTMNWSANGSGSGRIEGPDPGLPASLVWNELGEGTITYADGSTEPWHWFYGIGDHGGTTGGGTTGSTSAGSTGDSDGTSDGSSGSTGDAGTTGDHGGGSSTGETGHTGGSGK